MITRGWPDEVYEVTIQWESPVPIMDISFMDYDSQADAYLYKIIGLSSKKQPWLFYIGKTTKQYISKRLKDGDHQWKQGLWQEDHPRHKLMVSIGNVYPENFNLRRSGKRDRIIDDLESLLIYAHGYETKLKNKLNVFSHRVVAEYSVLNEGYVEEGMIRQIIYGLFYSERRKRM